MLVYLELGRHRTVVMKRGYYICYATGTDFSGVEKKIENQTKIFQNYFEFEKIIIAKKKTNFLKSIMWRMPFGSFGRKYEKAFEEIHCPDFIYIRHVAADRNYLNFIKEIRERYPNVELILEVPTYPYGRELLGDFSMFPFYYKDIWYRRRLRKYVDKVVTFSDAKHIFGISTIQTINGIIVDSITPIEPCKKEGKDINLLAVAMFQKYHGYERIIKGLAAYYNEVKDQPRNIILHMVGNGPEKDYYEKLVKKLKMEEHVKFWGSKKGKELDSIYNLVDIAVSSLGLYKLKINLLSALKTREYLAKGLPMITGCKVDVLHHDFPYYLEYKNDDSIIDIKRVIDFYDEVYCQGRDRNAVIAEIRQFAKEKVDMQIAMKPIVEYLNR